MFENDDIVIIEPSILEWARTRINMSISEVSKKIKIKESVVEDWEKGIQIPTYQQLEKLAYKIYKIPLAVFFLSEPPLEKPLKSQFRTISNNEINNLPTKLVINIRKGQYYQEVLKELFNAHNPNSKPIFKRFSNITESNLISIAKEIRNILSINKEVQFSFKDSKEAFKYYRNKIENSGIFIFQQTLNNYCRGYSLFDEEFPIIVLNSSEKNVNGKIFTIFHELSHILFSTGGITDKFIFENQNSEEILCNRLAANILIDSVDLLSNINIINNKSLEWNDVVLSNISKEFKVSKEVILRKLLDLKLTTNSFYSNYRENLTTYKKKKQNKGTYYNTQLSKLGHNYTKIVLNHFYNNRINIFQTSEFLNVKINHIQEIEKLLFNADKRKN